MFGAGVRYHRAGCRLCRMFSVVFGVAAVLAAGFGTWAALVRPVTVPVSVGLVVWCGLWSRYFHLGYRGRRRER